MVLRYNRRFSSLVRMVYMKIELDDDAEHVKVGNAYKFEITSTDVIHSFNIHGLRSSLGCCSWTSQYCMVCTK